MPIGRECDYVCSLCRHDFTYAGNLDPDGLLPHFCPNCGAANGSTTEPVTPPVVLILARVVAVSKHEKSKGACRARKPTITLKLAEKTLDEPNDEVLSTE